MAITLTPTAVQRVRDFVAGDPDALGLRVGVRRTGCSGWGYAVDVAREIAPADHVFELDGVRVVVDSQALPLLDGTQIDFVRQGLNRVFAFSNPNVAGECGCGESFSVERAAV
ncbi:MAG: iron-sulfur cluster assembly accessory protein [Xanthomonadales bacterium]|nr:Iron-binding protein IscA [Xanthomonadales bacterium]MCC6594195.1 iron-sulfur cluster assembly accessory protein [Xanthomonadales bacterium]MCE7929812.1 iron-sulfur cluster assembly accessory protein [Xanthomonadales bacterium PRO6]